MKLSAWILIICTAITFSIAAPARVHAQADSSGFIKEIRGAAFWRLNAHHAPSPLDPKRDAARRLYPEEQVRCAPGASLKLWLGREIRVPCSRTSWFLIPASSSARTLNQNRTLLKAYGDIGGINRGGDARVFFPSDHSAVVPGNFIIQWLPSAAKCNITFVVREVDDQVLWRSDNVDGASGRLDSPDAREKLIAHQAKAQPMLLTLEVHDPCRDPEKKTFWLLSFESDESLRKALAYWDQATDELICHLGRAAEFHQVKMFFEAAVEYEAALNQAPESTDLLIRASFAWRDTGNFVRKQELMSRLPVGTKIP